MNDDGAKVIPLDLNRFRGKRTGDVAFEDLVETFRAVVEANVTPRVASEVSRAIAPLQAEIERLRSSLQLVAEQVERVRMGHAKDAGLVITDDPTAAVTLASAKVAVEERYPFSTVNLAEQIPGKPSTGRVATVIDQLGMKGDPQFWCELKVGATTFNRYSKAAATRVVAAFRDPQQHLPAESPALRTVMNFLEGL